MNDLRGSKCFICDEKIMSEEDLTVCENCNNVYHKNCWQDAKERCVYCHIKIEKENINN